MREGTEQFLHPRRCFRACSKQSLTWLFVRVEHGSFHHAPLSTSEEPFGLEQYRVSDWSLELTITHRPCQLIAFDTHSLFLYLYTVRFLLVRFDPLLLSIMVQQLYKIFIRNLPWTVSSHELRTYFSQFGYVMRASVLYNNDTGLSRGFGYVDFNKRETFETVMSQPQHLLEGQRLRIEESTSKRRANSRDDGPFGNFNQRSNGEKKDEQL